jgi:hypothetical protein
MQCLRVHQHLRFPDTFSNTAGSIMLFIVARALVWLGRKPDYAAIARYVTNIEPLLVDYFHLWLERELPGEWHAGVQTIEANLDDKKLPFALRGRDPHAVALVKSAKERNLYDPVADGASMRNDTSAIGSRRMTLIILCSRTTLRFFVLTSRL